MTSTLWLHRPNIYFLKMSSCSLCLQVGVSKVAAATAATTTHTTFSTFFVLIILSFLWSNGLFFRIRKIVKKTTEICLCGSLVDWFSCLPISCNCFILNGSPLKMQWVNRTFTGPRENPSLLETPFLQLFFCIYWFVHSRSFYKARSFKHSLCWCFYRLSLNNKIARAWPLHVGLVWFWVCVIHIKLLFSLQLICTVHH